MSDFTMKYPDDLLLRCDSIIVNKQKVNEEKVDDYSDMLVCAVPARFPPIVVRDTPEDYVLIDGRHRLAAHKAAGLLYIRARVSL